MSIVNTGKNASEATTAKSYWTQPYAHQTTYHELEETPLRETDIVEQLRGNISRLNDLHGRLSYMMAEIGQLTKSDR